MTAIRGFLWGVGFSAVVAVLIWVLSFGPIPATTRGDIVVTSMLGLASLFVLGAIALVAAFKGGEAGHKEP